MRAESGTASRARRGPLRRSRSQRSSASGGDAPPTWPGAPPPRPHGPHRPAHHGSARLLPTARAASGGVAPPNRPPRLAVAPPTPPASGGAAGPSLPAPAECSQFLAGGRGGSASSFDVLAAGSRDLHFPADGCGGSRRLRAPQPRPGAPQPPRVGRPRGPAASSRVRPPGGCSHVAGAGGGEPAHREHLPGKRAREPGGAGVRGREMRGVGGPGFGRRRGWDRGGIRA